MGYEAPTMRRPILSNTLLVPMVLATVAATLLARPAAAAAEPGGVDMLPILAGLVLILIGAKLGGALFESIGQPAVLGELLAGIVLGNLGLLGFHRFEELRIDVGLSILAQIGVLFLLFSVGLEYDVKRMMAVELYSLLVANMGVLLPMVVGLF